MLYKNTQPTAAPGNELNFNFYGNYILHSLAQCNACKTK